MIPSGQMVFREKKEKQKRTDRKGKTEKVRQKRKDKKVITGCLRRSSRPGSFSVPGGERPLFRVCKTVLNYVMIFQ